MGNTVLGFVAGGLAAAAIAFAVWPKDAKKEQPRSERQEANTEQADRIKELEEENRKLAKQADVWKTQLDQTRNDLEFITAKLDSKKLGPHSAQVDPQPGPVTDEEIEKEISAWAGSFQSFVMGKGDESVERLRAFFKRGGTPLIKKLMEKYDDPSEDMGLRVVIGHALAQSNDPDALEHLKSKLRDPDLGMLEHRFAAHALAFSSAEGLEPFLTEVARNNKDSGARANAAFGLARRGSEEGINLYFSITDEAFEKGDPAAMQYMSGFMLIGKKARPGMRERLLTYKDAQSKIMLIEILKGLKDKGALANLNKLAYDPAQPIAVQNAAQAAIKAISKG